MMHIARFPALARRLPLAAAVAAFAALLVFAPPAFAAEEEDAGKLLEDFVYYTLIARPDMAAASAKVLLDKGLTDAELVKELESGTTKIDRFDRAIDKALRMPELQDLAASLGKKIHDGRLSLSRDPARIKEAIGNLDGMIREQRIAAEQLLAAGEYAVPDLLREIMEGHNETLKAACVGILRQIGRLAVTPLSAALPAVDPATQRIICDLLADIRYAHASPFLLEVSQDMKSPQVVRDAARRAFQAVGGAQIDLSTEYANLGRQYFNGTGVLVAYPTEETNNVWSYDAHVGLVPTPVATVIFNEVMAMRNASKALKLHPGNGPALALMVASNLKRENDLPSGVTDPIYGESRYTPQFYATVFGTQIALDVLAMAIDSKDTPLVRDAVAALQQTTGGANLFGAGGGRQPALEALQYPSRRVQYDTALVLGRALPTTGFASDVAVVPLLASAVRSSDKSFAVVIADEEENRREQGRRLARIGYTIVAQAADVGAIQADVAGAPAVDLVLIQRTRAAGSGEQAAALRSNPKTAGAAIAVLAPPVDMPPLEREFENNPRVKIASTNANDEALQAALDELMQKALGGRITEAEAEVYAIESMSTLRDIAVSGSRVYSIADAEPALLEAMDVRTGGTRLLVADILALIDSSAAQRKLFQAALGAKDDEQVELLNRVAESVKRFGSRAERQHVDGVLNLVTNSTGATAEAAARVHGALNLPSADAVKLLP